MNWNNLIGSSGATDATTPVVADNKDVASDTTMIVEWASNGTWASTGRGEENNVRAECAGELQPHVPESTETNDADLVAFADFPVSQR